MAWKLPIQARLLDVRDMRGVVVVSGTAYGDGGGGIPGLLLGSPRDEAGNLIMLGSGWQHWSTIHVADLAEVFRRVLEHDSARSCYIIDDGVHPTLAELDWRPAHSGLAEEFRYGSYRTGQTQGTW